MSKKTSKSQKTTKATTTKKGSKAKATTPPEPVAATTQAPAKAKKEKAAKPKRVSALDAAAQVLQAEGKPMQAKALIEAMAAQGLWTSPGGKTPHATLYAAMIREIATKGNQARFKKVDRGQFEFNAAAKA